MTFTLDTKNGTTKDPYNHKKRLSEWNGELPGISESDGKFIRKYIFDMRDGVNVTGQRGRRSPARVMTIRSRMCVLSKLIHEHTKKSLTTVSEEELLRLFAQMREGTICRNDGKEYRSVADYVISFKAFWHWYMKIRRKEGVIVTDITQDFDTSTEKPKFHYLTYEQIKRLADNAKPYYRMLIWFLLDTGIRAPTELMNMRVRDIEKQADGTVIYNIREETSKTFGRKPKLMLCAEMLEQYIVINNLQPNDFLFTQSPGKTNEYLSRLGYTVLGIGIPTIKKDVWKATPKGDADNSRKIEIVKNKTIVKEGITLYDFRHCSACYWLPKYKSESALKYRFAWKNSEMIHYYTELLGMKDTITQDDLIDSEEKTKLQKELEMQKQQAVLAQEQMAAMQAQLKEHEQLMEEQINELKSLLLKKGGFLEKVLKTK